jgi:hypothetical protein
MTPAAAQHRAASSTCLFKTSLGSPVQEETNVKDVSQVVWLQCAIVVKDGAIVIKQGGKEWAMCTG